MEVVLTALALAGLFGAVAMATRKERRKMAEAAELRLMAVQYCQPMQRS